MKKTEKGDWMNDALAQAGALVSDHFSYSEHIGLSDAITVSLRFIGNVRIGYRIFLILISEGPVSGADQEIIKANKHAAELKGNGIPVSATILCANNEFYFSNGSSIKILTEGQLADCFTNMDRELTNNRGGTLKAINKSLNDQFQEFTRANLSPYVTCNDIDALVLPRQSLKYPTIVELKRPVEEISKWRPYWADMANYRAANILAELCGGKSVTICYNESSSPNFLLIEHKITKINRRDAQVDSIRNTELWSWRITRERIQEGQSVVTPSVYDGKLPGSLMHWIHFALTESGQTTRILFDTSRGVMASLPGR